MTLSSLRFKIFFCGCEKFTPSVYFESDKAISTKRVQFKVILYIINQVNIFLFFFFFFVKIKAFDLEERKKAAFFFSQCFLIYRKSRRSLRYLSGSLRFLLRIHALHMHGDFIQNLGNLLRPNATCGVCVLPQWSITLH